MLSDNELLTVLTLHRICLLIFQGRNTPFVHSALEVSTLLPGSSHPARPTGVHVPLHRSQPSTWFHAIMLTLCLNVWMSVHVGICSPGSTSECSVYTESITSYFFYPEGHLSFFHFTLLQTVPPCTFLYVSSSRITVCTVQASRFVILPNRPPWQHASAHSLRVCAALSEIGKND